MTRTVLAPGPFVSLLFVCLVAGFGLAPTALSSDDGEYRWIEFPDNSKFMVLGLPWFEQNSPRLWRMPATAMESLPQGVQNRARCSSGGRIHFRSSTSRLALRVEGDRRASVNDFETFVNGQPCASPPAKATDTREELVLFEGLDQLEKEITIYLPHVREARVTSIGVAPSAQFSESPQRFSRTRPVVFYGSSVCQGSGAEHSGQTYTAIVSRQLNVDFVNLGFGGAGKAEPHVVELVNSIPACCYVFDLGKSYGAQDATAYRDMIVAIRKRHPDVPIIAITPITSAKEVEDPSYSERSVHTRTVMREPVRQLIAAGDSRLFLVEGEDLLGFRDHAVLSDDGVHPSDSGYALIAFRLLNVLQQALPQ